MKINITSEYIKLDQLLKFAGIVANGSDAKHFIGEGMVTVNGAQASQRGKKIRPGDVVRVGDQELYVC